MVKNGWNHKNGMEKKKDGIKDCAGNAEQPDQGTRTSAAMLQIGWEGTVKAVHSPPGLAG